MLCVVVCGRFIPCWFAVRVVLEMYQIDVIDTYIMQCPYCFDIKKVDSETLVRVLLLWLY